METNPGAAIKKKYADSLKKHERIISIDFFEKV